MLPWRPDLEIGKIIESNGVLGVPDNLPQHIRFKIVPFSIIDFSVWLDSEPFKLD